MLLFVKRKIVVEGMKNLNLRNKLTSLQEKSIRKILTERKYELLNLGGFSWRGILFFIKNAVEFHDSCDLHDKDFAIECAGISAEADRE